MQDLLDNWLTCQATWQYLEPIFSSPDILKQMPEEGDKFQQVDTMWRDLMEAAHKQPMVLKIAADPERLVALAESNKLLEDIQKVRDWLLCYVFTWRTAQFKSAIRARTCCVLALGVQAWVTGVCSSLQHDLVSRIEKQGFLTREAPGCCRAWRPTWS